MAQQGGRGFHPILVRPPVPFIFLFSESFIAFALLWRRGTMLMVGEMWCGADLVGDLVVGLAIPEAEFREGKVV